MRFVAGFLDLTLRITNGDAGESMQAVGNRFPVISRSFFGELNKQSRPKHFPRAPRP
jgi:5-carboxymethyl-2-hydroxymuconate isomerase